jgi:hypothetical protein
MADVADRFAFAVGDKVRYKPGIGTYGYEDALEADGRVPGVVIGHSTTRVRVRLTLDKGRAWNRAVDTASLEKV